MVTREFWSSSSNNKREKKISRSRRATVRQCERLYNTHSGLGASCGPTSWTLKHARREVRCRHYKGHAAYLARNVIGSQ